MTTRRRLSRLGKTFNERQPCLLPAFEVKDAISGDDDDDDGNSVFRRDAQLFGRGKMPGRGFIFALRIKIFRVLFKHRDGRSGKCRVAANQISDLMGLQAKAGRHCWDGLV